jgi:hypothetical protein
MGCGLIRLVLFDINTRILGPYETRLVLFDTSNRIFETYLAAYIRFSAQ